MTNVTGKACWYFLGLPIAARGGSLLDTTTVCAIIETCVKCFSTGSILPRNKRQVGLKTFSTLSTGEEIANPRFFRKEEKALAKVQRRHSKLAKGSPERRKHRIV